MRSTTIGIACRIRRSGSDSRTGSPRSTSHERAIIVAASGPAAVVRARQDPELVTASTASGARSTQEGMRTRRASRPPPRPRRTMTATSTRRRAQGTQATSAAERIAKRARAPERRPGSKAAMSKAPRRRSGTAGAARPTQMPAARGSRTWKRAGASLPCSRLTPSAGSAVQVRAVAPRRPGLRVRRHAKAQALPAAAGSARTRIQASTAFMGMPASPRGTRTRASGRRKGSGAPGRPSPPAIHHEKAACHRSAGAFGAAAHAPPARVGPIPHQRRKARAEARARTRASTQALRAE